MCQTTVYAPVSLLIWEEDKEKVSAKIPPCDIQVGRILTLLS
jgi:hypothetical protein